MNDSNPDDDLLALKEEDEEKSGQNCEEAEEVNLPRTKTCGE